MAEAVEKLDKSLFARKLGPRLRTEIGAAKFDPKAVLGGSEFPTSKRAGGRGSLSPRNILLGEVASTCRTPELRASGRLNGPAPWRASPEPAGSI